MPFCCQCGNQVGPGDCYCGRCGAHQSVGSPAENALSQISPRTATICCYIPGLGWIASIIVLASEKFRRDRTVRFHAFQGLYLFVAWLLNSWVLRPFSHIVPHVPVHQLVEALLLFMSIWMMVKAAHDEAYALPLFGELAQRSIEE